MAQKRSPGGPMTFWANLSKQYVEKGQQLRQAMEAAGLDPWSSCYNLGWPDFARWFEKGTGEKLEKLSYLGNPANAEMFWQWAAKMNPVTFDEVLNKIRNLAREKGGE